MKNRNLCRVPRRVAVGGARLRPSVDPCALTRRATRAVPGERYSRSCSNFDSEARKPRIEPSWLQGFLLKVMARRAAGCSARRSPVSSRERW
jgi:hypothetical protein